MRAHPDRGSLARIESGIAALLAMTHDPGYPPKRMWSFVARQVSFLVLAETLIAATTLAGP